jgi:hypothetical protein
MAVRTQEAQVVRSTVVRIAISMVNVKGDRLRAPFIAEPAQRIDTPDQSQ